MRGYGRNISVWMLAKCYCVGVGEALVCGSGPNVSVFV